MYLLRCDESRDDGSFFVTSVCFEQTCTLCLENGEVVKGGEKINMAKLKAA